MVPVGACTCSAGFEPAMKDSQCQGKAISGSPTAEEAELIYTLNNACKARAPNSPANVNIVFIYWCMYGEIEFNSI